MSELGPRLAELLHARAAQTKVTIDLDDVKRAGSVDIDAPERREQMLDRQGGAENITEFGASDYPDDERARRRWMLVAAATVVVLALGLLAVAAVQEPDSVQTDTVPPTPAPSTNPATTMSVPPVDSSPATLPANTTAPAAPVASVVPDTTTPAPVTNGWVAVESDQPAVATSTSSGLARTPAGSR